MLLPTTRVPDPGTAPALRWGVLGPGGIARSFVAALHTHTRSRCVAVGSRSSARAQAFAADVGADHALDYTDLVQHPDVEVVYVATPHSHHREHALLAIEAGKHVLIEKPWATSAAEATQIDRAAAAAGVFVMEAMWTRFLPGIDVLRQLLADGTLGEITTVLADHGQYFDPDPVHRLFNPDLAGGALLDLGIYPISLASMVVGTPDHVAAVGTPAFTGVDGQVSAVLTSNRPGGRRAHATLSTTLHARTPTTASITGTEARVELATSFYAPTELRLIARDGGSGTDDGGPLRGGAGLAYQAAHVAELIRAGATESPWMPRSESVSIMETVDRIRHAIAG